MDQTVFVPLFNNAVLLLVLSVIYEAIYLLPSRYRHMQPVFNGILIALICVLIMSMPFTLQPGIIYDTRSILICVTALFFGPIPTAVTVAAAALFRISIGGSGTFPGIAVIATSALIGLAWRRWLYPKSNKWHWLSIYAMSLTVHIAMLACMLLLPYPESLNVIRKIAVPVMVVYPAASVLLSLLLLRQQDHRRLNDQLKQSEEEFRYVFDNSVVGKSLTRLTGEMQVNKAMSDMLGYSLKELQGKNWKEISHPDDIQSTQQELDELISGKKGSIRFNKRYIKKDGNVLWADVLSSARRDASGNVLYLITSVIDITEQKNTLESLAHSENLYQTFINANTDMVFLKDSQLRYMVANHKLAEYYNKSNNEIIGKGDFELIPDEAAKQCRKSDMTVLSTKAAVISEESVGCRVFETIKFPIELRDNKVGVGGFIRDITVRKVADEQLRASEIRYRRLFESAKDGILILDAETGKIDDVNPYLTKLLQYSKEELLEKMIWEIGSFKNIIENKDNFLQLRTKGYIRYENLPLQTAAGKQIEVEFVSNVYTADQKSVIQCNIRDITERKLMEAELGRERDRARMYLDTAAVMMLSLDKNGTATLINRKVCELLGLPRENIIGKNWFETFVPKHAREDVRQHIEKAKKEISGAADLLESPIITATGEERLISWHNNFLRDDAGNIIGFFASGLDITEQKLAENAVKESEKKYKSYIENAPDGIFITDETGHYTEVNRAASEITGYSKDELLNMKISDFLPEGSKEIGLDHFKKLLDTGSSGGELQYKHKNGSTRWWSVDSVKLSDHRFLGFSKDITATKKAEEKLIYMSYHDQLTELFNRRYFEIQTRKFDNYNTLPLSVIMGDINGLKMINNAFGDAEGDRLIIDTAKIIKTCCREGDILARTGGGDFKILMPKTDFETAFSVLKEIQTACDAHNAELSDEAYFINISMGCATKTAVEESFDSVMKIAENYMYQRKLLENKSSRSSIIASITATMYAKSQETEEHCGRLVEISKMIGEALDLSERELDELALLAKLHDIGKVGIPERILLNPGKLSEAEWVEMKKHPEIGYRIAVAAPELEPIAEYILYHQEHWDGRGYPKNLAGEKIPLLSRIIAVADAYDAMTQDRVYRKAITHEAALEEIKKNAGTQFDPQIARLFIEVVSDEYVRRTANP